jgi:hypothetical protein
MLAGDVILSDECRKMKAKAALMQRLASHFWSITVDDVKTLCTATASSPQRRGSSVSNIPKKAWIPAFAGMTSYSASHLSALLSGQNANGRPLSRPVHSTLPFDSA